MSLPVRDTIQDLTPTAVARAMGFPISTIFRWMNDDRIPGQGATHDMRRAQFEAAVAKLRADKAAAKRAAATDKRPARRKAA